MGGKRSADAEPEADAEAGVALYGHAFGYPYGLRAYGAYPYAYGGYYGHYAPLVAGASSHQHVSTPAATYVSLKSTNDLLMPKLPPLTTVDTTAVDTDTVTDTTVLDTVDTMVDTTAVDTDTVVDTSTVNLNI